MNVIQIMSLLVGFVCLTKLVVGVSTVILVVSANIDSTKFRLTAVMFVLCGIMFGDFRFP